MRQRWSHARVRTVDRRRSEDHRLVKVPVERATATDDQTVLVRGVAVPRRPTPPGAEDCCMSGTWPGLTQDASTACMCSTRTT